MKAIFQHKKAIFISAAAILVVAALVAAAIWTEGFGLWRKTVTAHSSDISEVTSTVSALPLSDSETYSHPERLLGAVLRTEDDVQKAAEQATEYGFQVLFVPLTESDFLSQAIAACHDNGLLCYAVFSLHSPLGQPIDLTDTAARKDISSTLQNLISSYEIDGLLLENTRSSKDTPIDYARYLSEGAGMGLDAYRRECVTLAMREALSTVRSLRPNLPIGLSADTESMETGYADMLSWLNQGLFQYALIQNPNLCEPAEGTPSFAEAADWWMAQITDDTVALTMAHSFDAARAPDELCRQAVLAADRGYHGSVFNSLSQLTGDQGGETTALIRYLRGETIGSTGAKLSLSSPSKTTFTTYESSIAVVGSCDPGFPLTLNGESISCNEKGFFSFQHSLSPGKNKLTLENKGQTITLTVTYRQLLLKDVAPSKAMSVDGSSHIAVSAIARRGSRVTATLRSTTIELTPSSGNVDEKNSDYITYTGILTMPAATDLAQNMGNLTFAATYNGSSETKTGGRITVARQQVPTEELQLGNFIFDESLPLGRWGYVAEIRTDQAETFDSALLDDRSRSTNSYLPKGTIDYCSDIESVYTQNSSVMKYRTLDYGKRVYSYTENSSGIKGDYLNLYYCQLPTQNSLSVADVVRSDRHTTLTLNTQWKAPFEVTLTPQSYKDPYPSSGAPDYSVDSTTYTTLNIHFAYSVSGQGAIDMTNDPVFRSAEWVKESDGTYTLRLTLRKTGAFYGWGCNYNKDGQLVFDFLHPYSIQSASNAYGASLSGSVIVLDAGHGGNNPGATAAFGGVQYCEDEMNFALVCRIQDELESLGATVILTRDTDTDLSLYDRTVIIRRAKPDLMISVHRNSSVSASVNGFESYYYQPYSMAFCKEVNQQAASLFQQDRGIHYVTPMYVTRISECPAILIECGYMSNGSDMSSMIQESFDQTLAQKITQGVVNYLCTIG